MQPDSSAEPSPPPIDDLEVGRVDSAMQLEDWGNAAMPVDMGLIDAFVTNPDLLQALQQTAIKRALTYVREVNPPMEDEWTVARVFRESTAGTNMKAAQELRSLLRELSLGPERHARDRSLVLVDLARDTLASLKGQIDELRPEDVGQEDAADLPFMKQKATRAVNELIESCGSSAYDRALSKRLQVGTAIVPILFLQSIPLVYAFLANPTQFYLLGNLARGAVQAETELIGLARDPSPQAGMMWEHFKERQLGAIVGAVLFGVGTLAAHSGNQKLESDADSIQNFLNSTTWLITAAALGSIIYIAANHPRIAPAGWRMLRRGYARLTGSPPGQAIRLRDGNMRIATPSEAEIANDQQKRMLAQAITRIQQTTLLATRLVKTLKAATDKWEGNEEQGHFKKVGKAQNRHVKENAEKLQNLIWTIERIVGGVEQGMELNADERRTKRLIGSVLGIVSGGLGGISLLAAKKSPALLASGIPYYLSAIAIQVLQLLDNKTPLEEMIRTFGAYNGGTTLNLPASLVNSCFELFKGEGAFDLVNDNLADLARHPNRPLTKHPTLHPYAGALNLSIYLAYSVLTNALVGDKPGRWIANFVDYGVPKLRHLPLIGRFLHVNLNQGPRNPAFNEADMERLQQEVTVWCQQLQASRNPTIPVQPEAVKEQALLSTSRLPDLATDSLPVPGASTWLPQSNPIALGRAAPALSAEWMLEPAAPALAPLGASATQPTAADTPGLTDALTPPPREPLEPAASALATLGASATQPTAADTPGPTHASRSTHEMPEPAPRPQQRPTSRAPSPAAPTAASRVSGIGQVDSAAELQHGPGRQ
jgi:hypothetical protein